MSYSPFLNAAPVSVVHNQAFLRNPYNEQRSTQPLMKSIDNGNTETGREEEEEEVNRNERTYRKILKSSQIPVSMIGVPKHVLKVRETSNLLLFIGAAIGGVFLIDVTVRLITAIAHNRCKQNQSPPS